MTIRIYKNNYNNILIMTLNAFFRCFPLNILDHKSIQFKNIIHITSDNIRTLINLRR